MSLIYADRDLFAQKVKNSRNYYTHYTLDRKKVAQGIELSSLNKLISCLLIRCFFSELGFSSEKSKELFERNAEFKELHRAEMIRRTKSSST